MRPRVHVALTDDERTHVALLSRRVFGACAGIAVACIAWSIFQRGLERDAQHFDAQARALRCSGWDEAAGEAIGRLQARGDTDQASNAAFRLERARRSCEAGWVTLACQDYQTIIRGPSATSRAAGLPVCPEPTVASTSPQQP